MYPRNEQKRSPFSFEARQTAQKLKLHTQSFALHLKAGQVLRGLVRVQERLLRIAGHGPTATRNASLSVSQADKRASGSEIALAFSTAQPRLLRGPALKDSQERQSCQTRDARGEDVHRQSGSTHSSRRHEIADVYNHFLIPVSSARTEFRKREMILSDQEAISAGLQPPLSLRCRRMRKERNGLNLATSYFPDITPVCSVVENQARPLSWTSHAHTRTASSQVARGSHQPLSDASTDMHAELVRHSRSSSRASLTTCTPEPVRYWIVSKQAAIPVALSSLAVWS